jgi:hypothetical protein
MGAGESRPKCFRFDITCPLTPPPALCSSRPRPPALPRGHCIDFVGELGLRVPSPCWWPFFYVSTLFKYLAIFPLFNVKNRTLVFNTLNDTLLLL